MLGKIKTWHILAAIALLILGVIKLIEILIKWI